MSDFHFDTTIRDKHSRISIGVTHSEPDDEEVQINIRTLDERGFGTGLHLVFFLSCLNARELGLALIEAAKLEAAHG